MLSTLWTYMRLSLVSKSRNYAEDDEKNIPSYHSGTRRLSKANVILTSRRVVRWGILFLFSIAVIVILCKKPEAPEEPEEPKGEFDDCPNLLGPADGSNWDGMLKYTETKGEDEGLSWSRVMRPKDLMAMLERGETLPKRIIHQTWKNHKLPDRFKAWSKEWRRLHGRNWVYVLWTDEDNKQLARDYYPEYFETYDGLPREIYRVDMVRNMYMHRFGGIYADLDLVPLSPIHAHIPELMFPEKKTPNAYVGKMGEEEEWEHSIPNAFMASTSPGHPFWTRPLEFVKRFRNDTEVNSTPEALTGPVALRNCTLQWLAEEKESYPQARAHKLEVIGDDKIYPLSWRGAEQKNWCLCREHSPWFNGSSCNALYPNAWTITYWTHIWL